MLRPCQSCDRKQIVLLKMTALSLLTWGFEPDSLGDEQLPCRLGYLFFSSRRAVLLPGQRQSTACTRIGTPLRTSILERLREGRDTRTPRFGTVAREACSTCSVVRDSYSSPRNSIPECSSNDMCLGRTLEVVFSEHIRAVGR